MISFCLGADRLGASEELSAADLLALDSPALFKAADDVGYSAGEKFSTTELIKIAEKLARERKSFPNKDDEDQVFSPFFNAACEKATPEEIDQLVDIYVGLESGSFEKIYSLQPLAGAWIAREISGLDAVSVSIPDRDVLPEPELRNASPELMAGWKLYQNVKRKADPLFGESEDRRTISFQENEAAFYRLIDDLLRKRGSNLAERIAEFAWGGTCGTGAESLGEPQSIGILMALLHERRIDEAVGVAMRFHGREPLVAGEQKESVRIAFLTKCGLDWEAIFAGSLLATGAGWANPNLEELASEGSERALAFLTELALRAPSGSHRRYAYALAAFFPPDPEAHSWSSDQVDRKSPILVSADAQKKIIQVLEKFATPKAERDVAEAVVASLARAKSPETKRPLQTLLEHPSQEVALVAATGLRALGEVVAVPVRPAVQFRILANGKPLPEGTSLGWELRAESAMVSDITRVDESGTIKIPREHFQNEKRKARTVELDSWSQSPADAACFRVRVPIPKKLDVTADIDIEVTPVHLTLEPQLKPPDEAKSEATVRIQRQTESPELLNWPDWEFKTSMQAVTRLHLQKGTYKIEVQSPGAERFITTCEVGSREVTLLAQLRPGADVRVELLRPDGEREVPAEIRRNGRELADTNVDSDHRGLTYRGLAVGHYVLHVPSSAERAAEGFNFEPIQQYAGKDIPFTISGDTPLVDLGEIHLESAEKK